MRTRSKNRETSPRGHSTSNAPTAENRGSPTVLQGGDGVSNGLSYRTLSIGVLLFIFAVTCRVVYQSTSERIVPSPFQADSWKYTKVAFNLAHHGCLSLREPDLRSAPSTATDLAPGYPLLISCFLDKHSPRPPLEVFAVFSGRVRMFQCFLGGFTTLLTYIVGLQMLSRSLAVVCALLVAANPHLIVLDNLVLTEPLFVFAIMLGLALFILGWQRDSLWLLFLSGLVCGYSFLIRHVGLLIPFALAPCLFVSVNEGMWTIRQQRWYMLAAYFSAVVLVALLWRSVEQKSMRNLAVPPGALATRDELVQSQYFRPTGRLKKAFVPPNFFIRGTGHVAPKPYDASWKARTQQTFTEVPLKYAAWNLYARYFYMWHFDNAYSGNSQIYEMKRSGFLANSMLFSLHSLMWVLHWPLYALTICGTVAFVITQWRGRFASATILMPVILLFLCLLGSVCLAGVWLPRYSVPARPLSYLIAIWFMGQVLSWIFARQSEPQRSIPA